jgi:hypothetical protein
VVTEPDAPPGPYGLRPDEGDAYWFLDFLTTFKGKHSRARFWPCWVADPRVIVALGVSP